MVYWGTALSNAKFNNLEDVYKKNKISSQRILIYGSVDANTFHHIQNDWVKIEVASCGKNIFLNIF